MAIHCTLPVNYRWPCWLNPAWSPREVAEMGWQQSTGSTSNQLASRNLHSASPVMAAAHLWGFSITVQHSVSGHVFSVFAVGMFSPKDGIMGLSPCYMHQAHRYWAHLLYCSVQICQKHHTQPQKTSLLVWKFLRSWQRTHLEMRMCQRWEIISQSSGWKT